MESFAQYFSGNNWKGWELFHVSKMMCTNEELGRNYSAFTNELTFLLPIPTLQMNIRDSGQVHLAPMFK